jgi:beta-1,2-mannobiose phosphorylase / 1,2-beta-oligomannan phosphorylase
VGLRRILAIELKNSMTRRQLLSMMAAGAVELLGAAAFADSDTRGGWTKYTGNPVLGRQYGTCFDICVLHELGKYRMWLSWRPKKSVALSESRDGLQWSAPEIVLPPQANTGWEDDINRPVVVHRDDGYHMWYTGQAAGKSKIGYAKSTDGRNWVRQSPKPVLESSLPWEGVAVMCPHVMWAADQRVWKMWFSGGEQYEPNAIGYATSINGLEWTKYAVNPVLKPSPEMDWEKERVTGAQIVYWKNWYYAFYIGFRDVDHAQIGLARSKDGITDWVRHPANPIVRPTAGGWDADACYKPYTVFADGRWMLWYNGRNKSFEQIGLALHPGEDLGFQAG